VRRERTEALRQPRLFHASILAAHAQERCDG
jgi:hypothetical protein